jgi:hypothetical protein
MTAILLYLPNVEEGEGNLNLIVSPFIKEKHTLLKGKTRVGAIVLNPFLKKKRTIVTGTNYGIDKNRNSLRTIDGGNLPKDIGEQLIMLIHFF